MLAMHSQVIATSRTLAHFSSSIDFDGIDPGHIVEVDSRAHTYEGLCAFVLWSPRPSPTVNMGGQEHGEDCEAGEDGTRRHAVV